MRQPANWYALVLLASAAAVLFWRLGEAPVQNWDEGFYALEAREFGAAGFVPSIGGAPWLDKPLLGVAFTAFAFRLFGTTTFALRFFPAIFSVAAVFLVYLVGQQLVGRILGFIAALSFLFSGAFLHPHFARTGDFDTMLAALVLAAVYAYLRAKENPRWLIVGAAALGVAMLIRGTPALLYGGVLVLHAMTTRRGPKLKYWGYAALVFVAIALPWHLYAAIKFPHEFFNEYIRHSFFGRITGSVDAHAGSPWFYVKFLFDRTGPLAIVGIAGLFASSLLFAWGAVPLAVLTLIATKVNWYVLPIVPAVYLGAALLIRRAVRREALAVAVFVVFAFPGTVNGLTHLLTEQKNPPVAELATDRPIYVFTEQLGWVGGQLLPQAAWYLSKGRQISFERMQDILAHDPTASFITDAEGFRLMKEEPTGTRLFVRQWADEFAFVELQPPQ